MNIEESNFEADFVAVIKQRKASGIDKLISRLSSQFGDEENLNVSRSLIELLEVTEFCAIVARKNNI